MILKELSQLRYLNREIEMDKKRLEALKSKASAIGTPSFGGMPKSPSFENSIEKYIAEIVDLEAIIQAKLTLCLHERNRLERYIAKIPDSLTRQIFQLRYIDGLQWEQVAASIGSTTGDSCRMTAYRYIRRQK